MAVCALFGNNLQKYTFFGTFASEKQKKSKAGCGVVRHAINRLLGKVAVGIPKQVVKLVGKAVIVSAHRMGLGIWGVGVGVGSSCKILQFAAQPSCRGEWKVCSMA